MAVINDPAENTANYALRHVLAYNALAGYGIVSGCSISKGTGDWEIDVTAGTVYIDGTGYVSVSANGPTLTDPASDADMDAGESRIDLVTADTGGTLAAVEGTAASNPDYPTIPSDEVVVGFVEVAESDSTLADSTIVDAPVLPPTPPTFSAVMFAQRGNDLSRGNHPTYAEEDAFVRALQVDFRHVTSIKFEASVDPNGVGTDVQLWDNTGSQEIAVINTDTSSGFARFNTSSFTNNPGGIVDVILRWRAQSDTATQDKIRNAYFGVN